MAHPLGAGSGGITRGPGSAPLSWGEESPDLSAQMEMEALAAPQSMEEAMQLLQLSSMAPNVAPEAESTQAAGAGPTVRGEATWKRRLRPSHRQVVRRFFDSGKANQDKQDR